MLDAYKLVIFDLDGTLYEGTAHFDYYAKQLQQHVRAEDRLAFLSEYEEMKQGEHIVSIGKAYDVERDLVLTIDPMTLMVTEAYEWDRTLISPEKVEKDYPQPLSFDFSTIIAIGDGWWLPFVAAKHYGVQNCYPSYLATKAYMVTDRFKLERLEGLQEGLLHLQERTSLVLVTNSDREDVGRLLHELALDQVFEHIISSARKPAQTTGLFKELLTHYQVQARETVSVGDNFINDIAPALLLGMKGIYIHPHRFQMEHHGLTTVPSITSCFKKDESLYGGH